MDLKFSFLGELFPALLHDFKNFLFLEKGLVNIAIDELKSIESTELRESKALEVLSKSNEITDEMNKLIQSFRVYLYPSEKIDLIDFQINIEKIVALLKPTYFDLGLHLKMDFKVDEFIVKTSFKQFFEFILLVLKKVKTKALKSFGEKEIIFKTKTNKSTLFLFVFVENYQAIKINDKTKARTKSENKRQLKQNEKPYLSFSFPIEKTSSKRRQTQKSKN